jgi:hypothetical protein
MQKKCGQVSMRLGVLNAAIQDFGQALEGQIYLAALMSSFQNCIGPLFEGSVISIPGARNFG